MNEKCTRNESSCDDTSGCITDGYILSNIIQIVHQQYGGVVPELSLKHQKNIIPVVDTVLKILE